MDMRDCSSEEIRTSALTRMQCIHGCQHYKRHMFCPPACPDEASMQRVIAAYGHARICHERFSYGSEREMREKFASLHVQIMEQERLLRSENRFAMVFTSTACCACDGNDCISTHCRRPHVGRMPICATGIDMGHLITEVIGIGKEDAVLFWKGKLADQYFQQKNLEALFVGIVLY